MKFTVKSYLPEQVHGVEYMKNSHYIELTDEQGRVTRVNAAGIVMYHCERCNVHFFMFANMASFCPVCQSGTKLKPMWMKPQLAFIPEDVSDFRGGFQLVGEDEEETEQ